jgi:serine/threonine-protein kinase RsbW
MSRVLTLAAAPIRRTFKMPSIERKFTLQVPSSTENLALIREFVTAVGRQAQLEEPEITNLELAVDEACANVIEHAYGHDITKEVVVRAKFDDESLRISVIDEGLGFDPGSVGQDSVEQLIHDRQSGGLGIRLIKKLMDEVSYEIMPGQKNELHMTKKIRKS